MKRRPGYYLHNALTWKNLKKLFCDDFVKNDTLNNY